MVGRGGGDCERVDGGRNQSVEEEKGKQEIKNGSAEEESDEKMVKNEKPNGEEKEPNHRIQRKTVRINTDRSKSLSGTLYRTTGARNKRESGGHRDLRGKPKSGKTTSGGSREPIHYILGITEIGERLQKREKLNGGNILVWVLTKTIDQIIYLYITDLVSLVICSCVVSFA
ncbi:hypothetical protein LXL04_038773 [Taraxacum kok-saghyz]